MLDPDYNDSPEKHDRFGRMLDALECLVGVVGADRPLGEALRPGGAIDRLFSSGGLIDRLGTDGLNALIKDSVSAELTHLDSIIDELRQVAENLSAAATPLGRVAARVSKFLRKPLPYEMAQREMMLPQQEEAGVRSYLTEATTPSVVEMEDDRHALVNPKFPVNGRANGSNLVNGHVNGNGSHR